jgi:hypothetical protein
MFNWRVRARDAGASGRTNKSQPHRVLQSRLRPLPVHVNVHEQEDGFVVQLAVLLPGCWVREDCGPPHKTGDRCNAVPRFQMTRARRRAF